MPKRPLSAYNLFFQEARKALLGDAYTPSPAKRRHRKSHGKIGFTELAHIISQKWKTLDAGLKDQLQDQAAKNKSDYMAAVKQWKAEARKNKSGKRVVSPSDNPIITSPFHYQRGIVDPHRVVSPTENKYAVVNMRHQEHIQHQQQHIQYAMPTPTMMQTTGPQYPVAVQQLMAVQQQEEATRQAIRAVSQEQAGLRRVSLPHRPLMVPASPPRGSPSRQNMIPMPHHRHQQPPQQPVLLQHRRGSLMTTPPQQGPQVLVVTPDGRPVGSFMQPPPPPPVVLVQHPSGQLTYAGSGAPFVQ